LPYNIVRKQEQTNRREVPKRRNFRKKKAPSNGKLGRTKFSGKTEKRMSSKKKEVLKRNTSERRELRQEAFTDKGEQDGFLFQYDKSKEFRKGKEKKASSVKKPKKIGFPEKKMD